MTHAFDLMVRLDDEQACAKDHADRCYQLLWNTVGGSAMHDQAHDDYQEAVADLRRLTALRRRAYVLANWPSERMPLPL